jgi:hypothetical protein
LLASGGAAAPTMRDQAGVSIDVAVLQTESIPMIELLLVLCVALPMAGLLSELQRHRWISVVLGILSLAIVYIVTYAWCSFWTTFNLNVHFGEATQALLVTIEEALDEGETELVERELEVFLKRYDPNYENSPRYNEQAEKLVERLRAGMSEKSSAGGTDFRP